MDDLFLSFAEDIGLDLQQFDAGYSDPATARRVEVDVADGTTLGVRGTPTFFVDGQMLQPRSYEDLTNAIDEALANDE